MITFGHNQTFKKKFRDKSAIRLFESALYKAKEYTTIDKRFEKYIGVFENLVRKLEIRLEKYIKKEEQRSEKRKEEQMKRIEKELRTKRELARLKWTLSEKPTEEQKEQEKKKEQRLERELARIEWTMLS